MSKLYKFLPLILTIAILSVITGHIIMITSDNLFSGQIITNNSIYDYDTQRSMSKFYCEAITNPHNSTISIYHYQDCSNAFNSNIMLGTWILFGISTFLFISTFLSVIGCGTSRYDHLIILGILFILITQMVSVIYAMMFFTENLSYANINNGVLQQNNTYFV